MKRRLFNLALLLAVAAPLAALCEPEGTLRVLSSELRRQGSRMEVGLVLDYAMLDPGTNGRMTVTPVLVGPEQQQTALGPVRFEGRTRNKVSRRREALYGREITLPEVEQTIVTPNTRKRLRTGAPEQVTYVASVPYRPWMDGAELVLVREAQACGRTYLFPPLAAGVFHAPVPVRITFIIPEDRPKERSGELATRLQFPFDRAELLPGFASNAAELARIDSLTEAVLGDGEAEVKGFFLCGYASPEGPYAYNDRLSQRRMQSVRKYLLDKYPIPEHIIAVSHVPEDWEGVSRWAQASGSPAAYRVAEIIDEVSDPDARDARIRALDGGQTYRMLLREVYPPLRRVDYRIDYVLPPYNDNQAMVQLSRHPERLSLYEVHQLALRGGDGTQHAEDVWAQAVKGYPTDTCALVNAAAAALENGNPDRAAYFLRQAEACAAAQNNLGVAYLLQGERDRAKTCFREAAEAGSPEAAYNLEHFASLSSDELARGTGNIHGYDRQPNMIQTTTGVRPGGQPAGSRSHTDR